MKKRTRLASSNAFQLYSGRQPWTVTFCRALLAAYSVFIVYLAINITRAALLEQAAYNNDLPAGQRNKQGKHL